jgi:hypothetical protein
MFCTGIVVDPRSVRRSWRWVPRPPWKVYKEFLEGIICTSFGHWTGPFPFVGKIHDRWVGFKVPPLLLRDGSAYAYYVEQPPIKIGE